MGKENTPFRGHSGRIDVSVPNALAAGASPGAAAALAPVRGGRERGRARLPGHPLEHPAARAGPQTPAVPGGQRLGGGCAGGRRAPPPPQQSDALVPADRGPGHLPGRRSDLLHAPRPAALHGLPLAGGPALSRPLPAGDRRRAAARAQPQPWQRPREPDRRVDHRHRRGRAVAGVPDRAGRRRDRAAAADALGARLSVGAGLRRQSFYLLVSSLGVLLATDTGYIYLQLMGLYQTDSLVG